VAGALGEIAESFLPIEARRERAALEVVATRETQERRLHVGKELHDVGAVAIGAVVPGRRKERDEVQPNRAYATGGDDEARAGGLGDLAGGERHGEFLPLVGHTGNRCVRMDRRTIIALKADVQRTGKSGGGLRVKRSAVAGVGFHRNAPEAVVGYADARLRGCGGHVEPEADGQLRVKRLIAIERDGANAPVVLHHRPMYGRGGIVLKRAVAHELGVKPAVVGVVDLLSHQPVKRRADLGDDVRRINPEHDGRRRSVGDGGGRSGLVRSECREAHGYEQREDGATMFLHGGKGTDVSNANSSRKTAKSVRLLHASVNEQVS